MPQFSQDVGQSAETSWNPAVDDIWIEAKEASVLSVSKDFHLFSCYTNVLIMTFIIIIIIIIIFDPR